MKQIVEIRYSAFGPSKSDSTELLVKELLASVWPLLHGLWWRSPHDIGCSVVTTSFANMPWTKINEKRGAWCEQTETPKGCSTRWNNKQFQRRIPETTAVSKGEIRTCSKKAQR